MKEHRKQKQQSPSQPQPHKHQQPTDIPLEKAPSFPQNWPKKKER